MLFFGNLLLYYTSCPYVNKLLLYLDTSSSSSVLPWSQQRLPQIATVAAKTEGKARRKGTTPLETVRSPIWQPQTFTFPNPRTSPPSLRPPLARNVSTIRRNGLRYHLESARLGTTGGHVDGPAWQDRAARLKRIRALCRDGLATRHVQALAPVLALCSRLPPNDLLSSCRR